MLGFGLMLLAIILAPSFASADIAPLKTNVIDPLSPFFALKGPLTLCVGSASANTADNLPVCNNLCDLIAQIAQIIYFVIALVIWAIAPVLITVGGVMIMLGGASSELIGRGKKTITGAIWGIVIVLCAWVIVYTFVNAFGKLDQYVGGFGGNGGQVECQI